MIIERPSLKDQILNILRKKIITGDIKPGEIVIESEIARNFGVSRGPVHDVLTILEAEGFLSRGENGSVYVTTITKEDVFEIYSLRSIIEGLSAKIAVTKFNDEDIRYLDQCLINIAALKDNDGVIAVPNTIEIHRFVMEKAQHRRAIELWKNLNLHIKMLASFVMSSDSVEDTLVKHTKLVEALKSKNENIAEQAMRAHIMEAWEIASHYINVSQNSII
ncbi:MAG: GntR family transcriptional regulator [Peptococcales bacterium]|jgi:DNA-binding GntR family transcriptional regulator